MPVYLFTFHAYRTWRPDNQRGYTRRKRGYLSPDPEMARQYDENAKHEEVLFDARLQRLLIEEAQNACGFQDLRLHGGSTEPSHLHLLVSWTVQKGWLRVRNRLKSSLSRLLRRLSEEPPDSRDATRRGDAPDPDERPFLALSRGASRKQVRDRAHFDYLMTRYLPAHRGVKWFEDRGWI